MAQFKYILIVILWPLVRKFDKRRVAIVGFTIAAIGALVVFLGKDNMILMLGGLLIKSTGALPTYVMAALLAEALDHLEWKNGLRADGFSASVQSIIQTVVMGLSQTILLAGINAFGYIAPESPAQVIIQPEAIRSFFGWCFTGIPMIGYIVCAVIMMFYDIEAKIPQISAELEARKNEKSNQS